MARRQPPGSLGKGDLEQLLRRLAPQIAALFREQGASEAEARRTLGEALAGLARKQARIVNRERWLLRQIAAASRARK